MTKGCHLRNNSTILPLLFFVFFLCNQPSVSAQDSLAGRYIDITEVKLVKQVGKYAGTAYIEKTQDIHTALSSVQFFPGVIHPKSIPTSYVTKKLLVKLNLYNSGDTAASMYFFPGFYYRSIRLFKVEGTVSQELPAVMPDNSDSMGYRLFYVGAHDSVTLLAELEMLKTYINTIRPRLIHPSFLDSFISDMKSSHRSNDIVTYVFCGLLLMMILYSLANFSQRANREFLYYSGYAFFLGGMLLTKAAFNYHTDPLSFFMEEYLDYVMQGLGIMFYMIFMQKFLDTKKQYRFLHYLYNTGIVILILSILLYSYFHFFTDNFTAENMVENSTKVFLLVMVIIFLVYSIGHWKNKLLRYLFWGNLCLFVFALLSQIKSMTTISFLGQTGILGSALFYYEIGLLLELVFFLAGLNHKNMVNIIQQTKERERLKADNQMKEYEKELAVFKAQQKERERISADMHDELGSGMTAIRLMSEIARNKMKENTPAEIEKISHSANDVLNKMNAIIWSMNSGNDSLDNLVSYIRSYAIEYFENTPMQCKVNTPEKIAEIELSGDKRRNVFLSVKETLNNALKHSKASLITINITTGESLVIKITDNGTGIDLQNLRQFGNGLKNITRRMESIGGRFTIENADGTVTTLELPL